MKNLLIGLVLLVFVSSANAAVTTFGSLSYDDSTGTNIISDSLNNLQWLRWDVLADLNYTQTLSAIGAGGVYEGWSIARNLEAQLFVDALLGANPCTVNGTNSCGGPSISYTQLLGDTADSTVNIAWFLSDNGVGAEAGIIRTYNIFPTEKYNEWSQIIVTDLNSAGNLLSANPIPWLLYRSVSVPGASSLYLLAFGLLGLFVVTKHKI